MPSSSREQQHDREAIRGVGAQWRHSRRGGRTGRWLKKVRPYLVDVRHRPIIMEDLKKSVYFF